MKASRLEDNQDCHLELNSVDMMDVIQGGWSAVVLGGVTGGEMGAWIVA